MCIYFCYVLTLFLLACFPYISCGIVPISTTKIKEYPVFANNYAQLKTTVIRKPVTDATIQVTGNRNIPNLYLYHNDDLHKNEHILRNLFDYRCLSCVLKKQENQVLSPANAFPRLYDFQ